MLRAIYRTTSWLAHRVPLPEGKLRSSIVGRRGAVDRWCAWARANRGSAPLIWFHAASVGECQVAEPVVARLERLRPEAQVVLSYSSPSAATWRFTSFAHADFVPPEEPGPLRRVLDALAPDLVVFSRGDLWPLLVHEVAQRHVPVAVVGAGSAPTPRILSHLYEPLETSVSWVGGTQPGAVAQWNRLGLPLERIEHTGDPRHDRIIDHVPDLSRIKPVAEWLRGCYGLVAGSTEASDYPILLPAAQRLLSQFPDLRLIVVPHDGTETSIAQVERIVLQAVDRAVVWSGAPNIDERARLVVVSKQGLLADLYITSAVAYVGGGFDRHRLHSVAEPAAYAVPVLFGPRWQETPDASELISSGGGFSLDARSPVDQLEGYCRKFLLHPERRFATGLAARRSLSHGAAQRSAEVLMGLLDVKHRA